MGDVKVGLHILTRSRNSLLSKGLVSSLEVVNRNRVRVHLHSPISPSGSQYPSSSSSGGPITSPLPSSSSPAPYHFTIGSVDSFETQLTAAQEELGIPSQERIPVQYKEEGSGWSVLISLAPTLLLGGFLFWSMRRSPMGGGGGSGGIFGVGKSKAKMFNKDEDVAARFRDVAGMDEAKEEIMEFVKFLKEPLKYEKLGAKIPRGAILVSCTDAAEMA